MKLQNDIIQIPDRYDDSYLESAYVLCVIRVMMYNLGLYHEVVQGYGNMTLEEVYQSDLFVAVDM